MCLQNWLVFSEGISTMEVTFPVRLAKNCKVKFEQLWRVEQVQLFWTKACVGGILKSVWLWVQVGTSCGWGDWYHFCANYHFLTMNWRGLLSLGKCLCGISNLLCWFIKKRIIQGTLRKHTLLLTRTLLGDLICYFSSRISVEKKMSNAI